jgi:hypothetical protein
VAHCFLADARKEVQFFQNIKHHHSDAPPAPALPSGRKNYAAPSRSPASERKMCGSWPALAPAPILQYSIIQYLNNLGKSNIIFALSPS